MAESRVDVLVLAPDRPDVALVAEVKIGSPSEARAGGWQLKRYMLDRRCPIGLLVTPATTWIYRDSYRDYTESSIDCVAELSTADLLESPATSAALLERQVFDWLERLAASWPAALPTHDLAKAAVIEHLVPAVVEGRVVRQATAA